METQICNKCGRDLPLDMFHKRNKSSNGYARECKQCKKKYYLANKTASAEYYEENKISIAKRMKEYGKIHKEHKAEYSKSYREKHSESLSELRKEYYEANKDVLIRYAKEYREENKEVIAERKKEYRNSHRSVINEYYNAHKSDMVKAAREYREANKEPLAERKKEYRRSHMEEDRARSQKRRALKKSLPSTLTITQWDKIKKDFDGKCAYCGKELPLHQDHFVALSKGGEYSHNNIVPSCQSCNSRKSDKAFMEWYPRFTHYSKKREVAILKFLNYKHGIQQLALI